MTLPVNWQSGQLVTATYLNTLDAAVNLNTTELASAAGGPNMLASNGSGGFEPADWAIRMVGNHQVPARRTWWANKPNTANASLPLTDDTGQAIGGFTGLQGGNVAITNGKLYCLPSVSGSGAGGWYRYWSESSEITRIGVRFVLDNQGGTLTTANGGVALCVMNETYGTYPTFDSTFRMGAHFGGGNTYAQLMIYDGSTSTFTVLGTWTYARPLAMDGTTVYEMEIFLAGNTATCCLPDGSIHTVTNSNIGAWSGNYAFIEQAWTVGTTDNISAIVEYWAGTGPQYPPSDRFVPASQLPQFSGQILGTGNEIAYASVTGPITVTTSVTDVTGLVLSGVPQSPYPIMLEANLGVAHNANGTFAMAVIQNTGGVIAEVYVNHDGTAIPNVSIPTLRYRIPPNTPTNTYHISVFAGSSGGTFNVDALEGGSLSLPAYIRATY